MKFEFQSLDILKNALEVMQKGFEDLPEFQQDFDYNAISAVINEAAEKMHNNYPYFHPYYAGQMLKPPHPAARIAYMLSMWINPNNHALDGGRMSSQFEKEAVAKLAALFGWKQHLGHLTGGGTIANMEALWIAGKLNPDKAIAASENAHYIHSRLCEVLKIPFISISCDDKGRMDLRNLEKALKTGRVGTVVPTMGTTGSGSVDPLAEIVKLREKFNFRIHADAAYGGYFILADNLKKDTKKAFEHLKSADSIVIDPHKHGLQPYGCGCVLFKDPSVGVFYRHDSPYTYFTSGDVHLGEISLECSRAGASAVALWATQKLLPMTKDGEFARGLSQCRGAALDLYDWICGDDRFLKIFEPELDIVVWAPKEKRASLISQRSREIFKKAADRNLHLALFKYPSRLLRRSWSGVDFDADEATCLRSCLMKPEHKQWLDRIWGVIDEVC